MTWHKYNDPGTLRVPDCIPLDKPFPAIDDRDKFCMVWCQGEMEHGGSAINWVYIYSSLGIQRSTGHLKIKAWFEIPVFEGRLFDDS